MDWIKIEDGYVRKDTIVDVHINRWSPSEVMFVLVSGDSTLYKRCESSEEAKSAMEDFINWITGKTTHLDTLV